MKIEGTQNQNPNEETRISLIRTFDNNVTFRQTYGDPETKKTKRVTHSIMAEYMNTVPTFDGTNIFKFTRAIIKIKNIFLLTEHDEVITRLKLKLTDRVFATIGNVDFRTTDEFIFKLKTIFATPYSSGYYSGKLVALIKRDNESMITFIDRFLELYNTLRDCICLEDNVE